jgi:hypothetical protein
MSFVDNGAASAGNLASTLDRLQVKTDGLVIGANSFSTAMARAFTQATVGGRQFDDVLKSLALRLSNLAVTQAFKPITQGIFGGLGDFFGGTSPLATQVGAAPAGIALAGSPAGSGPAAAAAPNVTVQIATPDAASFRRSEAYITGQIARAVARGQRGM